MVERGVGEYQIKKAEKSRIVIINTLAHGKWKQYNELVRKAGLSTATVSKYLKKLEKEKEIEKKIDLKSGEYPYPVYYRLTKKGFETRNKEAIKKRIEETPLEFSSLDITRRSLKAKVDVPEWYKKLNTLLAKIGVRKAESKGYNWPTTYSGLSDSSDFKEWKNELSRQINSLVKKRHPKLDEKLLDFYTQMMMASLTNLLEETTHLNILTPLKMPPKEISKWKPIAGEYESGLYAEIYSRLLEIAVLILRKKYELSESFEEFLEETRGTSLMLTFDLQTDFHRIIEHHDKKLSEWEQGIIKIE